MPLYPAPVTVIDDDDMSSALPTNVPSAESVVAYVSTVALLPYAGAKVSRATGQTLVATGTLTPITWTVEDWDETGWWTGGAPTRLTVPSGVGKVEVKANVSYAFNATGRRILFIRKNGSTDVARIDVQALTADSGPTILSVSCDEDVVAGDYFEINVYQTSGGNMTVGADFCAASIKRIDD